MVLLFLMHVWKAKGRETTPPCPSMCPHGKPEAGRGAAKIPQNDHNQTNLPGPPCAYMGVPA